MHLMQPAPAAIREILPRVGLESAFPVRPTLLWVDDSEALLGLYLRVFESLGFKVATTSSPQEALNHLSSHAIDVAILDYEMPEMNGGTLAALIKACHPQLPVILYTGSTCISSDAYRSVDAICQKTDSRGELLATIARLSAQREQNTANGIELR